MVKKYLMGICCFNRVFAATLLLVLGLFAGCISPKSSGSSGKGQPSRRGIEEFLVRPGISQYFLLPVYFSANGKSYSKLDVTTRDSTSQLLWCTIRLSFNSQIPFTTSDSLFLNTPLKTAIYLPTKILFTERKYGKIETRMECQVPTDVAKSFIGDPAAGVLLKIEKERILLTPSKKAKKRFHALKRLIYPLG